jgi:cyclic-di-AMP phosphodiesterase PgpH
MSTPSSKRTRSERVASLQLGTVTWKVLWHRIANGAVLLRLSLALITALIITVVFQGWNPPFPYRDGYVSPRAIVARVEFEMPDPAKTALNKAQQAREVVCIYENRRQPLLQLRGALKDHFFKILGAKDEASLDDAGREALSELLAEGIDQTKITKDEAIAAINSTLGDDRQLLRLDSVLTQIFTPLEEHGLLPSLSHDIEHGNQRRIQVLNSNDSEMITVDVSQVRIAEVLLSLRNTIPTAFKQEFKAAESEVLGNLALNFLRPRLPTTLVLREDLSDRARREAVEKTPEAMITFEPEVTTMVPGGMPLRASDLEILRAEYKAWLEKEVSWKDHLIRLAAFEGMIIGLYLLCGILIYYQFDRTYLTNIWKLIQMLGLALVCIILCSVTAQDPWRAEIVPLVMCAITAAISFGRALALMHLIAIALIITLSLGMDLSEFVLLTSAAASTILLLGRIRTRTRLIYVGASAAAVVCMTAIGVGTMVGQSTIAPPDSEALSITGKLASNTVSLMQQLMFEGARQGVFTIIASLLMTGLLPVVERIFGVQTDLSLLELGDASHPLLRQLAQRAPGTYNHSINVAALAETAADSIGAHGLLTRVGAYFHDIGKMFKPNYFVENQSQGNNRHDSLQPAMSTLVIIAHVKDGADLARQHNLPKPIIDFIEQHHGTTLVEYFFRQATKKSEESPYGEEVSDLDFRYPGPKPQTVEAAILMLSDAVESASRSLVEPTPGRLQNLVDEIAMKRLLDGQFDECGITLCQLDQVKLSLVKSLTAIYHGRIKYPGQQTA